MDMAALHSFTRLSPLSRRLDWALSIRDTKVRPTNNCGPLHMHDLHYPCSSASCYPSVSTLHLAAFALVGLEHLWHPPESLVAAPETWAVLGIGFLVDGFVLRTALNNTRKRAKRAGVSTWEWLRSFKDPFTVAVVFEDSAAVAGVLVAALGIGLTQYTGNPMFDVAATLCISGILGAVSLRLIQMNHSFILGRPLSDAKLVELRRIIKHRQSVDEVHGEQSQWIGPSLFSYKAEVDFDGTWLAAQLYDQYEDVFVSAATESPDALKENLPWILPAFAEDLTRILEREVNDIQAEVRERYPEAGFVEIVPDSSQNKHLAIEAFLNGQAVRAAEKYQLNAMLTSQSSTDYVSLFNLGRFYEAMGHFEKAASVLDSCRDVAAKQYGMASDEYLAVLDRFATMHLKSQDNQAALSVLKTAENIIYANSKVQFDLRLVSSINATLGFAYRNTGNLNSASTALLRSLDAANRVYDTHHPAVTALMLTLAEIYARIDNRKQDALKLYTEVLGVRREAYGNQDKSVADVLGKIADMKQSAPLSEALEARQEQIRVLDALYDGRNVATPFDVAGAYEKYGDLLMRSVRKRLFLQAQRLNSC
eukprot:m.108687 g.108687  ORF g.108687 m.108687 type:complete len:593 (-) comp13353_c0_seq2:163-1941(-)